MEVIIFGFVNLLYLAFIIGAPLIGLYVLYKTLRRAKKIGVIIFFSLIILPITWGSSSYVLYKNICSTAQPPTVTFKPSHHIDSVLIDDTQIRNFTLVPPSFSDISTLVEENKLAFFEVTEGLEDHYYIRHGKNHEQMKVMQPRSQYKILLTAPMPISKWWFPPIYKADISIIDQTQNKTILNATDWIFGGGLVGIYLRLMGGDQDYNHLSCGYISNEIGTWRPTLSTDPRQAQYAQTDSNLILNTFTQ